MRGLKFVEKWHIIFPTIFCRKQPSKGALSNRCAALVVKNRFKDIYIPILVLPVFETKQGVTILKKPQEELINWYVLFATPSTTEVSC